MLSSLLPQCLRLSYVCLSAVLINVLVFAGTEHATAASGKEINDVQGAYEKLRVKFVVAKSFPASEKGLSKKHRRFLKKVSTFIRALPEKEARYRQAAYFLKGRILLKCRRAKNARKAFDRTIELAPEVPEPAKGVPSLKALKVFRVATFVEKGFDAMQKEVDKLEDVPDIESDLSGYGLDEFFNNQATSYFEKKKFDEALALYKLIKAFKLWDPEKHRSPKRMIRAIKFRKKSKR